MGNKKKGLLGRAGDFITNKISDFAEHPIKNIRRLIMPDWLVSGGKKILDGFKNIPLVRKTGDALKRNPVTGKIYSIIKGMQTGFEKAKTAALQADLNHAIQKIKTFIIKILQTFINQLKKGAMENGKEIKKGELNKETKINDFRKEDLKKSFGKEADLQKGLFYDKESDVKLTNNLSKTISDAGEKVSKGLGIAGGMPGMENPGLNMGK